MCIPVSVDPKCKSTLSTEVDRDPLELFSSEECFHFTGIDPIKHTSIGFNVSISSASNISHVSSSLMRC